MFTQLANPNHEFIQFSQPKPGNNRNIIQNYFDNIEINKFNISNEKLTSDLCNLLKTAPSVEVIWNANYKLNEKTGINEKLEFLDKIVVLFFNDNNMLERFEYQHN